MPLRIFYVDDEEDLLEILRETLSGPDVEVTTFSDWKRFLTAVEANPPDAVFIDQRLPGISGQDLAGLLPERMPKALVTGDIGGNSGELFSAVFTKPVELATLRAFIAKLR